MGLFDFIGDALGAVASPFTAVIDAGGKLLGLPPALTDAIKVAVGACTGDVFTAVDGGLHLLKDLAGQPAETEYAATPKDEAYGGTDGWAASDASESSGARSARAARPADRDDDVEPTEDVDADVTTDIPRAGASADDAIDEDTADDIACLETLKSNFDALNHDHGVFGLFGDKVLTEKEIRETAENPDAPLELKKACRHLVDNPDLMEKVLRSKDGGDHGIARGDLDLALQELKKGQGSGATGGTGGAGGSSATPGRATDAGELSALRTLLGRFDEVDRGRGFLAIDSMMNGGILTQRELQRTAEDPNTDPALKRAARWMLDHPAVLDKLSASKVMNQRGMSRNDLLMAIEDVESGRQAPVGRTGGSTGTGPRGGTAHHPAPSTGHGTSSSSGSSSKKASSSGGKDPSISDILNDKSLSTEEKIEMILLVLENRADDDMVSVAKQMDKNDDKKTNKDDRKKQTQLDKVDRDLNFKMERLMKRKEQLSNLLSTMEMKFASMAQTAIANMGR